MCSRYRRLATGFSVVVVVVVDIIIQSELFLPTQIDGALQNEK